jgi:hypothetical protein
VRRCDGKPRRTGLLTRQSGQRCLHGYNTEAMRRHELPPAQRSNLASGPAIAALVYEEHAQLVEADQRFQAALEHAIATGSERLRRSRLRCN